LSSKIQIDRVLSTVAFFFIASALCVAAAMPPAAGYEISIYAAYPWYFWLFVCGSIACGIYVLVHHAFMGEEKSKWWLAGLCAVIFANLIVILLPLFRGYLIANGQGDDTGHLANIRDILLTGHLGTENAYPISHILSSELSFICGLDATSVIRIIPAVFYLAYMMGLYLLARKVAQGFGQALLVMAFGSVLLFLFFEFGFFPTHNFLCLVPLVLFLLLTKMTSTHRLEYAVVFVVLLILLPFTHPYGSILLAGTLLVFGVATMTYRALARRAQAPTGAPFYALSGVLVPALIILVTFFTWFWHFSLFRGTVVRSFAFFVGEGGKPVIAEVAEKGQMAGLSGLQFVDLMIRNYGHCVLYMLLSSIAIVLLWRRASASRLSLRTEHIFFALLFVLLSLLAFATIVASFVDVGQDRTLMWALVASTLLNGLVFYEWLVRLEGKRLRIFSCLLTAVIVVSAIMGVFSVYPSPYLRMPNMQATRRDWDGMEWFLVHKNSETTYYLAGQFPWRFPGALLGASAPRPRTLGEFEPVPPRFGYSDDETFGHSSDANQYLVIEEFDRAYFVQLWPDLADVEQGAGTYGVVTSGDFTKLDLDPTASRVYFNGGLEIWRVSIPTEE